MSLISDALKTAQRERAGRNQAAKDPQPMLDGFFPYVSTAPARRRSRLVPTLVVSLGAIGLLAVVGWLVLPMFSESRAPERRVPVRVPPPAVTQASAPDSTTSVDSQAVAVTDEPVRAQVESPAPEPRGSSAARRGTSTGGATVLRSVDEQSARTDTTVVRGAPIAPVSRDEPPARVDYEAQATALFNLGDLAGARDKFLLATRTSPNARAWTNYGVTLQKLGDLTGAAAAYQSAIGVDANYLEAWLYQGRLAIELGDVARAVPLLQRARSINPRHSDVNVELARLESEARNWTETRRFAEDAVRGDASNARGHWYLAIAADQLKDLEAAAREYAAYLQTVGSAERDQSRFVGYARERLAQLRGRP